MAGRDGDDAERVHVETVAQWRDWLAEQWASLGQPVGAVPAASGPEPAWADAA